MAASPIAITDADDPRLAPFRGLKERDLIHSGHFIAEGRFILETLLTRSRFRASAVLVLPSRLAPLGDLFAEAPEDLPLYVAERAIMEQITGYDVHRGILALGMIENAPPLLVPPAARDLRLVISSVANPENIGAMLRNAAAFGVREVLLDARCCHPLYRRAIRVSMGASLVLPWRILPDMTAILHELSEMGFTPFALTPFGGTPIEGQSFPARTALVFGEEAHGLDPAVMARMARLTIAMDNGTDSLNVAATSAVALHMARLSMATIAGNRP